jgi:hypothetical protein
MNIRDIITIVENEVNSGIEGLLTSLSKINGKIAVEYDSDVEEIKE